MLNESTSLMPGSATLSFNRMVYVASNRSSDVRVWPEGVGSDATDVTTVDHPLNGCSGEPGRVAEECVGSVERVEARLDDHHRATPDPTIGPFVGSDVVDGQLEVVVLLVRHAIANVDHVGGPDELGGVELIDRASPLDEMTGRIEMGARVGSGLDELHEVAVVRNVGDDLDMWSRVAGEHRCVLVEDVSESAHPAGTAQAGATS